MHYSVILFLSNLFSSDMIIIVFVALLLFGGEKLPEIARGLGKGIRDFKDASEGIKREINDQINNYDVSKEDKKIEEAIIANQQASQNQISAVSDDNFVAGMLSPVPNTMPVNENAITNTESETTENKIISKEEPVINHQLNAIHAEHEKVNEPIRNL